MTQEFFDNQIQRLSSTFGKNAFSDERVKLIWNSCNKLSNDEFAKITNFFIASSRQAPLPEEFRSSASNELNRRERERADVQFDCRQCDDVGFFEAMCIKQFHEDLELGRHYTFMCNCAKAPASNSNWKAHYGEYYVPTWDARWPQKYNELVLGVRNV